MKSDEVLALLQKHEQECSQRFADVEQKIDRLDNKLWGIVALIILASGLEQLL